MAHVRLQDVYVAHELFTSRDYNLKRQLIDSARRRRQPRPVIQALGGVSLDIPEGSRLGLIGANGAGKSTLLSIIAGLLPPTRGTVEVNGRVLALLGAASAGLDQEATGRDNIITMGLQLGESPADMRARIDDVTEFSGLSKRIDHAVHTYSSGMQARLRFSILTSLRPDVLVIDEGISTADAEFSDRAGARLAEFLASAGILVLASHGEALIEQHCESAVWLDQGVVMGTGRVGQVLADYRAAYARAIEESPPDSASVDQPPAEAPDYERIVARAYWQMAGRPPDAHGLALHVALMRDGLTLDELNDSLFFSDEAVAAREAWSGEVYFGISHDVPYSLRSRPGAKHLVVTFAGIGTHRFLPLFADNVVSGLPVHELALGLANHRSEGSKDGLALVWDSAELIRSTADKLGVSYVDVICIGHSGHAQGAVMVGLYAQAGHIIAGAPPVKIGSLTEMAYHHLRAQVAVHVTVDQAYERWMARDPNELAAIDAHMIEAARAATHNADITVFAAPRDLFYGDCRGFVADVEQLDNGLRCTLVEGSYPDHDSMGPEYEEFAKAHLTAIVEAGVAASAPADCPRPPPPYVPVPLLDLGADGEPSPERLAYRAYWQILGRNPDSDGAIERLKAGLPFGQLLADIHASTEARDQRAAWTGGYYLGMFHDIPYSLRRRPGARYLIVRFPGVGTHRYIPRRTDGVTDHFVAHNLALGVAMKRPMTIDELATSARDEARLVEKVADDLGIAKADIVCIGHSFHASPALAVGLEVGAGHLIVGAPPPAKGIDLTRGQSGERPMLNYWLKESTYLDPAARARAENQLPDLITRSTQPATIEIFISRDDVFWAATSELAASLDAQPNLTCVLTEGHYGRHSAGAAAYRPFLLERLASFIAIDADASLEDA